MTNSIEDVCGQAQVILLVGSNPEEAHPVMGMRIRQAVERGAKLIVVDPRDIGLASKADIHLKLRPGTNVAFANGMAHVIIAQGLADKEFVENRTEASRNSQPWLPTIRPKRWRRFAVSMRMILFRPATMYAKADRAPIHLLSGPWRSNSTGHRRRYVHVQHGHGLRQIRQTRLWCQPPARPEQRSGRVRHGCRTG